MLPRRDPARSARDRGLDADRRARRRLVLGARGRLRRGAATPSPATRTSRTTTHDADHLVDACRAVLAQVGDGDALAISCFWHSLVAVDEHDRPADAGAHVARRRRRSAAARSCVVDPVAYHRRTGCFLHPAYWPAKLVRLAEEASTRRATSRSATTCCLRLDRRGTHERLDRERHRALRPEPRSHGTRRRSTRSASTRRGSRPCRTTRSRASGRRSATARARTSARAASSRGRAAVMVGTSAAARVVYDGDARAEGRALPLPPRRRALLRRRRALRRRQPARVAAPHAARRRHLADRRPSRGRSRADVPAVPRRRALTRLGPGAPGRDRRADVRDHGRSTSRRPRSRASATGWPTCSTRSAASSRSSRQAAGCSRTRPGCRCSRT